MSKFDPLEEAKVTNDDTKPSGEKGLRKKVKKLVKRKKSDKPEEASADSKPEEGEMAPVEEAPKPPASVKPEEPKPEPKPPAPKSDSKVSLDKVYRVTKGGMVSFNGQLTSLSPGKVLKPQHYGGVAGIEHILAAGVEIEEC